MSFADVIARVYLPLLTQETAVMVSTFTYGYRTGLTAPALVAANTAAVLTDLVLFFLPAYLLSDRLHDRLERRFGDYYRRITRLVDRIGVFRTAAAMAFVMPSVAAMLCIGLLRLAFWRGLAGLFIGSALYVVIPLVLALPLAASVPNFLLPFLPWIAPILAIVVILLSLLRSWKPVRRQEEEQK
jgi:membrane protein DedA with SNARE-associated domain